MIGAHLTHRFIRRLRIVFILAIAAVSLSLTAPPAPVFADPLGDEMIDVTAVPYQAAGDGVTNDRAAIQKAIDDASNSGGGTVVLPAGRTFLTGNLFMKNNVTLRIGGTLKQSQNPDDYMYEPVLGHRLSVPPGTLAPRSWVGWYVN